MYVFFCIMQPTSLCMCASAFSPVVKWHIELVVACLLEDCWLESLFKQKEFLLRARQNLQVLS